MDTNPCIVRLVSSPADFILSIQERNFRSKDGEAELFVLAGATGHVATTPVSNIQKANLVNPIDSQMTIYNLSDGAGNSEPTDDGVIFDTDFVLSSGSGSNASGGFSPQTGSRLYPAGALPMLKVTNLENSNNRISLEYSWIELPADYLN